jgi:hypothetical protein
MTTLATVALLIDNVQVMSSARDYQRGGVLDWHVLRHEQSWKRGAVLAKLFAYPHCMLIPILQILACSAAAWLALTDTELVWMPVAVGVTVLGRLAMNLRNGMYSLDASDQMLLVTLGALMIFYAAPTPFVQTGAMLFVACQVLLCYFVSGMNKLASTSWRSGAAIVGVVGTLSYGNATVAAILQGRRRLALAVSWTVIVLECASPLWLLAGFKGALYVALLAALFNIATAIVMGLNSFAWAFGAAYPAVVYTAAIVAR